MPVGFESKNTYGVYQIDDTFKNIQLVAGPTTVTSSMTQVNTGSTYNGKIDYYYYDITVNNATNPVIAIRPTACTVARLSISGSTWTFRVFASSNETFTYYVFDAPTTSGNFGLEVYNSSGELQFASSRKPFKPIQLITTTAGDGIKTTTLSSGTTYAGVIVSPGVNAFGYSQIGDPKADPPTNDESEQVYELGSFTIADNVITTSIYSIQWYYQFRGDDYTIYVTGGSSQQQILIIDVTNY